MDKTYFFDIDNDDTNKMIFKFTKQNNDTVTERFKKSPILQFHDLLAHYGVDTSKHISSTTINSENNEPTLLNVTLTEGVKSKNHIRDKIGMLRKENLIISNPYPVAVKNLEYKFNLYNIDDDINNSMKGIFIFTITIENREVDATWQTQYPHVLLRFDPIIDNNKDCIAYAKRNGALHFLHYSSNINHEMEKIILDIKERNSFKMQLAKLPEMFIPDDPI